MKPGGMRTIALVAGVLLCAALPVVGARLRSHGPARCALDGVMLEDLHRVDVVSPAAEGDDETATSLCCIQCARAWIELSQTDPERVRVIDEETGAPVDAASAWFVRSRVVTVQDTGDRVHAFANKDDAVAHVEAYRGRLLVGGDHPFASYKVDR